MKNFLSNPRKVISIFALAGLLIGVILYHFVGQAPTVVPLSDNSLGNITSSSTYDLAFQASGKVAAVNVKIGDAVKKGQTLVSLDAGAALGAVNQAKGALELAQSQYGSQNVQYVNTKKAQDVLVNNAYSTLLSSGLQAVAVGSYDESHNPIITGTYTCGKEGSYEIAPYGSEVSSGYSFYVHGLEESLGNVTFNTPTPIGKCGLFITFVPGFSGSSIWDIQIPNTRSTNYRANKNAYDLAVATRDQVLNQILANTTSASVTVAEGAYQSALATYRNYIIVAPVDGTINFIDPSLKNGQLIITGKVVISIDPKI